MIFRSFVNVKSYAENFNELSRFWMSYICRNYLLIEIYMNIAVHFTYVELKLEDLDVDSHDSLQFFFLFMLFLCIHMHKSGWDT